MTFPAQTSVAIPGPARWDMVVALGPAALVVLVSLSLVVLILGRGAGVT